MCEVVEAAGIDDVPLVSGWNVLAHAFIRTIVIENEKLVIILLYLFVDFGDSCPSLVLGLAISGEEIVVD